MKSYKNLKIKIIEENSIYILQKKINRFIKNKKTLSIKIEDVVLENYSSINSQWVKVNGVRGIIKYIYKK